SPRLLTTNENYENNYFSFFPSAHITYKLKKKLELTASYSRRINRPNSRNLNPFPNYSDPLNLRVGNPALNPEYINSYEVGVLQDWKKLNFSSTAYFRHTTDVIQRIKEFYDDGTSAVKFVNLSEKYNYGIEMVGVYRPFKIWKNIISFNAYGTQYKDNSVQNVTNNAGFSWNVKLNSTIDLFKNTTTVQLTTSYVAKRITAQGYIQPKRGIDISVNRRFFDKKLTLGLQLQDVFNNKGFVIWIDQPDVQQYSEYKWQSRRLRFNISYKFGKLEMSRGKDMPTGGGEGFDF
ncbi:outer membrane beta-barrel family protein, partial [Lishizhenia sp.]|uniref:outer membrane beta-barrel family protein n=1 Tax=Lishizhenia sp. TaxID=2497594 RepID=UPI00299D20A9